MRGILSRSGRPLLHPDGIEGEPIRLDDGGALARLAESAATADLAPTLAWLDRALSLA